MQEVTASHDGPCTSKDVEDIINVERANMRDGNQHLGQPAIFHRAMNSKVLPDADKEQFVASAEDMVTVKEKRTVPEEVHWAKASDFSLGKEHLEAQMSASSIGVRGPTATCAHLTLWWRFYSTV